MKVSEHGIKESLISFALKKSVRHNMNENHKSEREKEKLNEEEKDKYNEI